MQKLHLKLKKAKIEGITVKWLFNVLGVIALIFIAVFVAACFSLKSFYYSGVENVISAGVSTVADNYFSIYEDSGAAFKTTAANFIEDYPYKDRTTVWVIDADGSVVSSSSGFVIDEQDMPDYDEALTASDSTATWTGRLASGEKAMAICRILYDADSNQIGAVRVLASLEQVDKQISTICLLLALILLAFFGLIVFSNVYFIRSIIIPVQQISETTKLIAKGNLGARIEYKSDDEIGELCTSINRMAGFTTMPPRDIASFLPQDGFTPPEGPFYLVVDPHTGTCYVNREPDVARKLIDSDERLPLTLAFAGAVCHPILFIVSAVALLILPPPKNDFFRNLHD